MVGEIAYLLFGDLHAGAGGRPDDFLDAVGLIRMVRAWVERHPDAQKLEILVLGDVIDFGCVYLASQDDQSATDKVACAKLDACLRARPDLWAVFRDFLRDPRAAVVFLIGNHDLEFAWPAVQERLASELSPADPGRVSFAEEVVLGDILVAHGDCHDAWFAKTAVGDRFREGELIAPLGARISSRLFAWLWRWLPPLGLVAQRAPAWFLGLIIRLRMVGAVYRRVATLGLRRHLVSRPGIKIIVAGHIHVPGVSEVLLPGGRRVAYYNCGVAAAQPRPLRFWKRRFTELTPVEIVMSGDNRQVQLLRFDPAAGSFSEWQ